MSQCSNIPWQKTQPLVISLVVEMNSSSYRRISNMEQPNQAENVLTHELASRDANATQATSSEPPLSSTSTQGQEGRKEQPSHLSLSSRGRPLRENPKFMNYETDLAFDMKNLKQLRKTPIRRNSNKGQVTEKILSRCGGRKHAIKLTEDGDQEMSEKLPAESCREPSYKSPKKAPMSSSQVTIPLAIKCAMEDVPTEVGQTESEQPKPKRKQVTKRVVKDVRPAETLADQKKQGQTSSATVEEQEIMHGSRPRRGAAKAALKLLHDWAKDMLVNPSNNTSSPQGSRSGHSSPIAAEEKAPKGGRARDKGKKRKHPDIKHRKSYEDEDFIPGGIGEDEEEEEEETEGILESDLESAVDSIVELRRNKSIQYQGRKYGTAPNGLPNNMLQPCSESTKCNKTFREKHQSSWVFPEWIPSMNDWKTVPQSDLEEYLPQEMQSATFKISREGLNKETPLQKLNRFEAMDKHPERWDTLMFTGGPVWALEWCPSPDGSSDNQYVALACHQGMDDQHYANEKYTGTGLIQLWDLGKLEYDSSPTSRPSLVYGLAQDKGFIWQLKWCPAGAWELPTCSRNAPYLPRLGLLAAATSTGIVTIYSIPHPQALLASKKPIDSEHSQVQPIFKVNGVITLKLGSFIAPHNKMNRQVLSMDWSAMRDHDIMALGFYDGLVGLWNLSSTSSFMRIREPDHSLALLPYRCFQAHDSCVRALAFCPAASDLLVTAGDDRMVKVWDLTRLYDYITAHRRHLTTEVFWPLNAPGLFLSQESSYAPNGQHGIYYLDLGYHKIKPAFMVPRMATMWSMSFNDWLNSLVTSDTLGEVIFDLLPQINGKIQHTKKTAQRRFPVYFTDMVPYDANTSDETEGAGEMEGEDQGEMEGPSAVESERVDGQGGAESLPLMPQTYREAVRQYYLHYRDSDMRTFKKFQERALCKRMQNTEVNAKIDFDTMPMAALHKVRFNPNMSSHTWLVSGGQAGLVRVHCLRSMYREDTKKMVMKCKKQFTALYHPENQSQATEDLTETQTSITPL